MLYNELKTKIQAALSGYTILPEIPEDELPEKFVQIVESSFIPVAGDAGTVQVGLALGARTYGEGAISRSQFDADCETLKALFPQGAATAENYVGIVILNGATRTILENSHSVYSFELNFYI